MYNQAALDSWTQTVPNLCMSLNLCCEKGSTTRIQVRTQGKYVNVCACVLSNLFLLSSKDKFAGVRLKG